MRHVKFICVNFNNSFHSKRLLGSLASQKGLGLEFTINCVIVDNSTDAREASACEQLSDLYPWSSYLRPTSNLGYFGGLNYGMRETSAIEADFMVICNNDLEFDENFCARLSMSDYEPRILAVCPDVITTDGLHQNPHILTRISRFRRFQFDCYFAHFYVSRLLIWILKQVRPVKSSPQIPSDGCELHMGVGACYVLTHSFLTRFESLNYPFFLYGEEAYISEQIHSAGGILWFDPGLRALHAESAALSRIPNRVAYEFARRGYPGYRKLM